MTTEAGGAVERWTHGHANRVMVPAVNGDYVRFEDYAAERAAREAAEARATKAERDRDEWRRIAQLGKKTIDTAALAIAEAESALAAERAAREAAESALAALRAQCEGLAAALRGALGVIDDYLEYDHNGDPWVEDRRCMREMEADDAQRDGRLDAWRALLGGSAGGEEGDVSG